MAEHSDMETQLALAGQPRRIVALERAPEHICSLERAWKATGWEPV